MKSMDKCRSPAIVTRLRPIDAEAKDRKEIEELIHEPPQEGICFDHLRKAMDASNPKAKSCAALL